MSWHVELRSTPIGRNLRFRGTLREFQYHLRAHELPALLARAIGAERELSLSHLDHLGRNPNIFGNTFAYTLILCPRFSRERPHDRPQSTKLVTTRTVRDTHERRHHSGREGQGEGRSQVTSDLDRRS